MFDFTALSRDRDGTVQEASIRTAEIDGVRAVYADDIRRSAFDPEEAVTVRIGFSGEVRSILSIREMSPFWTEPSFSDRWDEVPEKTNCVLCSKADGSYAAVVPVVGAEYKSELSGGEDALLCHTYSWYAESD